MLTGIDLDPAALELAGVMHHRSPKEVGRVGMVFRAPYHPDRHGEPFNAEPHKCAGIAWHATDALPEDTVPYTTACVDLARRETLLGLHGWEAPARISRR